MRHVSVSELKDKASEIVSAAEAGEDITITRHGREVVKLVGLEQDRMARQRAAVDAAYAFGQEILRKNGPTTAAEIRAWIEEDRP